MRWLWTSGVLVLALAACDAKPVQKGAAASSVAPVVQAAPSSAESPEFAASSASSTSTAAAAPEPLPPAATPPFIARAAIAQSKRYRARMARIEAMVANAEARDVNGDVREQQYAAEQALDRCANAPCVEAWFSRREAALKQWAED